MGDTVMRALHADPEDPFAGPLAGFMGDNIVLGAPNERLVVSSTQMITSVQPIPPSMPTGGFAAANFTTTTFDDGSSGKWQLGIDFLAGGVPRADVLAYTLQDGTKGFLIVGLKSPTSKSLTYETSIGFSRRKAGQARARARQGERNDALIYLGNPGLIESILIGGHP